MKAALAEISSIAVIVFAVSSMFTVGLAYGLSRILGPLRDVRAVFRALIANFVLVPLWAVGLERVFRLEPPLALGLFLLAGSAGAPFLIKLASAAKGDLALSAALLVLLVPATVVFLPFYVPVAMAHPTLRAMSYEPSSMLAIGVPLLSTLVLPIGVGLAVRATVPRWARRLAPVGGKVSTVALGAVVVSTLFAHLHEVLRVIRTGAIGAGLLLVAGAFVFGFLLSRQERSAVLGLGTAQRNIAGAMVIASRDFSDPDVLVMITASVLAGLALLFPVAWLLSRRRPHLGPPTAEGAGDDSSPRRSARLHRPAPDAA